MKIIPHNLVPNIHFHRTITLLWTIIVRKYAVVNYLLHYRKLLIYCLNKNLTFIISHNIIKFSK